MIYTYHNIKKYNKLIIFILLVYLVFLYKLFNINSNTIVSFTIINNSIECVYYINVFI